TQKHFAHILGKADDGEDSISVFGNLARTIAPGGAGVQERFGLVLAPVVHRCLVALIHEMLAHPAAHDTRADPAHSRFARFRAGDHRTLLKLESRCKKLQVPAIFIVPARGFYGYSQAESADCSGAWVIRVRPDRPGGPHPDSLFSGDCG